MLLVAAADGHRIPLQVLLQLAEMYLGISEHPLLDAIQPLMTRGHTLTPADVTVDFTRCHRDARAALASVLARLHSKQTSLPQVSAARLRCVGPAGIPACLLARNAATYHVQSWSQYASRLFCQKSPLASATLLCKRDRWQHYTSNRPVARCFGLLDKTCACPELPPGATACRSLCMHLM